MIKRNKAFTLIELIVVLVILAIIALITTPIILNIIDKAQVSANKRSIDAYGKAVELAIAEYLLDTGEYPNDMSVLTINYTGNIVECEKIDFLDNNGLYLSKCSVDGVEVKDEKTDDGYYHYASASFKIYNVGDKVTYNSIDFYVIANGEKTSDYVTLLKAEPLTVDEVNTYGAGHVNKYTISNQGTVGNWNSNGYGGMTYYSSETCGYVNGSYITDGCTTDYEQSDVKYAVDAWATDKFDTNDLTEDSLGYKVRLLTFEELTTNLGYAQTTSSVGPSSNGETPSWVYNGKYYYWTMSQYNDSASDVWYVTTDGDLSHHSYYVYDGNEAVRPVVTLLKSAL